MNEYNNKPDAISDAMKKLELMEIADSDEPGAVFSKKLIKQIDKKDLTPSKAKKLYEAYLKKEKNKFPPITAEDLREGTYNVFVGYPPNLPEKGEKITDVKNAALFLMAPAKKLKEMIELMESWGFILINVAVWKKLDTGGTYFNGMIQFLLLGIKGNMVLSENWKEQKNNCPIIFEKLSNDQNENKIPERVYDMAEKMFPGQRYTDIVCGRWPFPTDSDYMELSCHDAKVLSEYEMRNESSTDSRSTDEDQSEENSTYLDSKDKDQSNKDWL